MIGVILYESFAAFEIVLATYLLKTKFDIVTIGLDSSPLVSMEGLSFIPQVTFFDSRCCTLEGLIIPGGLTRDHRDLLPKIRELSIKTYERGKVIGAICNGILGLCGTKILENRSFATNIQFEEFNDTERAHFVPDKGIVSDQNILNARPEKYIDFALAMGRLLHLYKDEEDFKETVRFFRDQEL